MLRLIGGIMIICAGGAVGFLKADGLKKRADAIGKIITGLALLETDIGYGRKSLKETLLGIGESQGIGLFLEFAKCMDEIGIKKAICSALLEEEHLKTIDKAPILELGETLGMTDAGSQIKAIKRSISVLSERKTEAEDEYKRLGKLYREGGVLGGILGAVILI